MNQPAHWEAFGAMGSHPPLMWGIRDIETGEYIISPNSALNKERAESIAEMPGTILSLVSACEMALRWHKRLGCDASCKWDAGCKFTEKLESAIIKTTGEIRD